MNHLLPLILAVSLAGSAQTAAPKFEVESVKRNQSGERRMGMETLPGGKVVLKNLPLHVIIGFAYDLPFQSPRLSGGPDWIRSENYDIEAVPPSGLIPSTATMHERDAIVRTMLQALLAERFKLVIQRETKDLPIYAVTVGKRGVKLTKAEIAEKDCLDAKGAETKVHCHAFHGGQGRGLHSDAATIEDAALFVSNWADRPVIDQTGLQDLYQFDTPGWVPMRVRSGAGETSPEGLDDPLRPSLFSIFDQMGLKLESRKGPIDMFTIQSVERPTEN